MSTTTTPSHKPRRRRQKIGEPAASVPSSDQEGMPRSPRGQTTSLESISIQPRTPKTSRSNGDPFWHAEEADPSDEVELSLLGDDERLQAAQGMSLEEEQVYSTHPEKRPMSTKDKRAIALLVILCDYVHTLERVHRTHILQISSRDSQCVCS